MAVDGSFSCGRQLYKCLYEDRFDKQPERSTDGRFLLVADVRLDNRDDLLKQLGRQPAQCANLSDSRILFELLLHRGERTLDALLGDYSFAFWDGREKTLTLARDPLGERPLHFSRKPEMVAFASMPQAVARVMQAGLNERQLARFIADRLEGFKGSFFEGVTKVAPGEVVTLTPQTCLTRKYWNPKASNVSWGGEQDLAEALRERLDVAVARRLRRARGKVAAHLSSGFDSNAVATSAALSLDAQGETMLAYTSAPANPPRSTPTGWLVDESASAIQTSSLYQNMQHHVIRSQRNPLDLMIDHRGAGQPVGSLLNNAWWSDINEHARDAGASVMLTGEAGNFTLSAGLGWDDLPDVLWKGQFVRWWSEARALARKETGWSPILRASMPAPIRRLLMRARQHAHGQPENNGDHYLSSQWKERLSRTITRDGWSDVAYLNGVSRRLAMMSLIDPGAFRKRSLARWGIEERDPTADRELVEFCLALPIEARLRDGVRKPALRQVLAGRAASSILQQQARGLQSADWQSRISKESLEAFATNVRSSCPVDIVDWDAVERTIREWPFKAEGNNESFVRFSALLRALSTAQFCTAQLV